MYTAIECRHDRRHIAILLVFQVIFVATVVVTDESLWIDEFGTARIADVDGPWAWWRQFRSWHNSDIQMPGYHCYIFLWSQLFGLSEYAMRMANLPLLTGAAAVVLWTFRRELPFCCVFLFLTTVHPLIWYYLNEARPYTMMLAGAVWILCSLASTLAPCCGYGDHVAPYEPWIFVIGALTLAGSHMLGGIWTLAALAAVVGDHRLRAPFATRRGRAPYALLAIGLALLACFYAYTVFRGARPARYPSTFATVLFSGYELLGLSGLGPGRLELREHGIESLKGWAVPLSIGSGVLIIALIHGLAALSATIGGRRTVFVLIVPMFPMAATLSAGSLFHWRVLGRHLMPAAPLIVGLIALSVVRWLERRRPLSLLAAAATVATVTASGLSMTCDRQAKDDYRYAAEMAKQALAHRRTVWWAASPTGARYYNLPTLPDWSLPRGDGSRGISLQPAVIEVANLTPERLERVPHPSLVVLSKPDAFDIHGAVTSWLRRKGMDQTAACPAFTFWEARPPEHEP